jgi:membrane protease YdiL (CAAX protease family)
VGIREVARSAGKALLFLALAAICVVIYLFLLSALRGKAGAFSAALPAFVLAGMALLLNWRFLRSERRSLADLGFHAPPRLRPLQLFVAFGGGVTVVAAWAFVLGSVTGARWHRVVHFDALSAAGALTFTIFNNAAEELVYRAYLFVLLMRSYGAAVAVVMTSALFTLLHIQAGIPWPNALAVVFTSALIFAASFLRWRSVPLVLAFHAAMNVAQEFLGMRLSGLTVYETQFRSPIPANRSAWVLGLTAALNLAIACAIFFPVRNTARIASS